MHSCDEGTEGTLSEGRDDQASRVAKVFQSVGDVTVAAADYNLALHVEAHHPQPLNILHALDTALAQACQHILVVHLSDDYIFQHRPLQVGEALLLDHLHNTQELRGERSIQLCQRAAEGRASLVEGSHISAPGQSSSEQNTLGWPLQQPRTIRLLRQRLQSITQCLAHSNAHLPLQHHCPHLHIDTLFGVHIHKLHRRAQLELLSFRADEGVDADPPVLCHNEAPDAGEAAAQKRLNRHRVVGPDQHIDHLIVGQEKEARKVGALLLKELHDALNHSLQALGQFRH
mmetsp:Transcript_11383/g.29619  ORF Transcript_11383/g.29619 Transcript_11383/m.29619 type:complete len:287 (-) Transcript_11383:2730-3590(-)